MALTPEDVVKKEFTKPKGFGRSGYDEIQVDDFLDEIVVELRRLNAENEDLTGKLEDCRRSKGLAGRPAGGASPAATSAANVPGLATVGADKGAPDKGADKDGADKDGGKQAVAAKGELDALAGKVEKARQELSTAEEDKAKALAATKAAQQRLSELREQIGKAEQDGNGAGGAAAGVAGAAGVIELAQRLHDEHVKEGETTRDRLIAEAKAHHEKVVGEANAKRDQLLHEGQATHDNLVGKGRAEHDELVRAANEKSTTMVKEAEDRKSKVLGELSSERDRLNKDIEQLRTFERDYRTKLRGYIQGQLEQLDKTAVHAEAPQQQH